MAVPDSIRYRLRSSGLCPLSSLFSSSYEKPDDDKLLFFGQSVLHRFLHRLVEKFSKNSVASLAGEVTIFSKHHVLGVPREGRPEPKDDRAKMETMIWKPTDDMSEAKLQQYISGAEKYGYSEEQALGMLLWHKHDVENAMSDLPNFYPCSNQWTIEDKVLFTEALHFHGKKFSKIRQMLPDKSVADLVNHYYSVKTWSSISRNNPMIAKRLSALYSSSAKRRAACVGVSEVGSITKYKNERANTKTSASSAVRRSRNYFGRSSS